MSTEPAPKKKKGFLDKIGQAIANEVLEKPAGSTDDATPTPAAKPAAAPAAPMLSAFTAAPASPAIGGGSQVLPSSFAPSPAIPMPAVAEPVDPETLAMLEKEVLVEQVGGKPSRFMLFLRMWEALQRPADPNVALRALVVTNPNLTAKDVLDDAQAHLSLLDAAHARAEAEFAQFAQQTLGGTDAKIKALQEANDHAAAEIARHQKEMGERAGNITALQAERAKDEAAVEAARRRTNTAEGVVRAQLQNAQSLLTR